MKIQDTYAKIDADSDTGKKFIYCSFSATDSDNNRAEYQIEIRKHGIYVRTIESAYRNEYYEKPGLPLNSDENFGISVTDLFNLIEPDNIFEDSPKEVIDTFLTSTLDEKYSEVIKRLDILFLKCISEKLNSNNMLNIFFTTCSMTDGSITIRDAMKPFNKSADGLLNMSTRRL